MQLLDIWIVLDFMYKTISVLLVVKSLKTAVSATQILFPLRTVYDIDGEGRASSCNCSVAAAGVAGWIQDLLVEDASRSELQNM